jgi:hypothetical protein
VVGERGHDQIHDLLRGDRRIQRRAHPNRQFVERVPAAAPPADPVRSESGVLGEVRVPVWSGSGLATATAVPLLGGLLGAVRVPTRSGSGLAIAAGTTTAVALLSGFLRN